MNSLFSTGFSANPVLLQILAWIGWPTRNYDILLSFVSLITWQVIRQKCNVSLPTRNTLVSSQAGFDPGSLQTPRTTPGLTKSWPTHPRPWEPSSHYQACLQRALILPCQSCQKVHQGQELSHLGLTIRNCIMRREQSLQFLIRCIKDHLGGQWSE